jgi:hypothetical protein
MTVTGRVFEAIDCNTYLCICYSKFCEYSTGLVFEFISFMNDNTLKMIVGVGYQCKIHQYIYRSIESFKFLVDLNEYLSWLISIIRRFYAFIYFLVLRDLESSMNQSIWPVSGVYDVKSTLTAIFLR